MGEHVLVVDDESLLRSAVRRIVERAGHACHEAVDATSARTLLDDLPELALALLDLRLPDGSGLDLAVEIGASRPDVAVVMLTGVDDPALARRATDAGAYGYLVKPVPPSVLRINIDNALRRRELERERRLQTQTLERLVEERTADLRAAMGRLEESQRAKDAFMAVTSHELRTPLTPMLGWAKIVRRQPEPTHETAHRFADVVLDQGARLLEVVDAILRVAQLGGAQAARVPVDVRALLDGQASLLRAESREVEVEVAPAVARVAVDAETLVDVLGRVLDNVLKFAPDGPIELRAREDDGFLVVDVVDHGPGVPPGDAERIFDSFTQAAHYLKRTEGGLGVGLYLASAAARGAGGRVWQSDTAGGGATFSIALPIADAP